MICVPQPPALMDFRDPLDGADNANDIGANWRSDFSFMKLITNRAQLRTPGSNTGRQGAWETYVPTSGYNGGRLLTDNWAVESQLIAPVGGAATDNLSTVGGAMMDGGPGVGMVLVYFVITTGNGQTINTYAASSIASPGAASGQAGQTQRSVSATNVPTNAVIRLERRMYSATQSTFTAYVNGTFSIGWNDSTGIVPAGDRLRRRWFIQAEGNFPLFQQAFYSPAHASVRAYDLRV
jgi:hypothetical protein